MASNDFVLTNEGWALIGPKRSRGGKVKLPSPRSPNEVVFDSSSESEDEISPLTDLVRQYCENVKISLNHNIRKDVLTQIKDNHTSVELLAMDLNEFAKNYHNEEIKKALKEVLYMDVILLNCPPDSALCTNMTPFFYRKLLYLRNMITKDTSNFEELKKIIKRDTERLTRWWDEQPPIPDSNLGWPLVELKKELEKSVQRVVKMDVTPAEKNEKRTKQDKTSNPPKKKRRAKQSSISRQACKGITSIALGENIQDDSCFWSQLEANLKNETFNDPNVPQKLRYYKQIQKKVRDNPNIPRLTILLKSENITFEQYKSKVDDRLVLEDELINYVEKPENLELKLSIPEVYKKRFDEFKKGAKTTNAEHIKLYEETVQKYERNQEDIKSENLNWLSRCDEAIILKERRFVEKYKGVLGKQSHPRWDEFQDKLDEFTKKYSTLCDNLFQKESWNRDNIKSYAAINFDDKILEEWNKAYNALGLQAIINEIENVDRPSNSWPAWWTTNVNASLSNQGYTFTSIGARQRSRTPARKPYGGLGSIARNTQNDDAIPKETLPQKDSTVPKYYSAPNRSTISLIETSCFDQTGVVVESINQMYRMTVLDNQWRFILDKICTEAQKAKYKDTLQATNEILYGKTSEVLHSAILTQFVTFLRSYETKFRTLKTYFTPTRLHLRNYCEKGTEWKTRIGCIFKDKYNQKIIAMQIWKSLFNENSAGWNTAQVVILGLKLLKSLWEWGLNGAGVGQAIVELIVQLCNLIVSVAIISPQETIIRIIGSIKETVSNLCSGVMKFTIMGFVQFVVTIMVGVAAWKVIEILDPESDHFKLITDFFVEALKLPEHLMVNFLPLWNAFYKTASEFGFESDTFDSLEEQFGDIRKDSDVISLQNTLNDFQLGDKNNLKRADLMPILGGLVVSAIDIGTSYLYKPVMTSGKTPPFPGSIETAINQTGKECKDGWDRYVNETKTK